MRILVTGGAGFIGSWVAESFLGQGHQVAIVDNMSTGVRTNVPPKAALFEGDIRDTEFLTRVFSEFRPEVVNHHAAQINVRHSAEDPKFDAEVNVLGSLNLMQLCVQHRVHRFLFASTGGAIYGEAQTIPTAETTLPVPTAPYGVAKLSVENYLRAYRIMHGLQSVCLRYANVYGPRQNAKGEAGVIAIFCTRAQSHLPCTVFGDGNQTRDYVFVDDIVEANRLALEAPEGIYNIGTGVETSVTQLIHHLNTIAGRSLKIESAPARSEEIMRSALDATVARSQLGWKPTTSLSTGLERTWKSFLVGSQNQP